MTVPIERRNVCVVVTTQSGRRFAAVITENPQKGSSSEIARWFHSTEHGARLANWLQSASDVLTDWSSGKICDGGRVEGNLIAVEPGKNPGGIDEKTISRIPDG